ncbi:sulfotransferase family protein [Algirhabdus cladophorae]|uniref:sulfotransferase family protein n=1 Tax=Algirhabdus cladophorae TaxID=3377108 RepID=UPI003B849103
MSKTISNLVSTARASNEHGTFDHTRAICEQIFAVDPGNVAGLNAYVTATKVTADDPVFTRLQEYVGLTGLPVEVRSQLHFMLGKCFADLGRVEDAFATLVKANDLKSTRYDPVAMRGAATQLITAVAAADPVQLAPIAPRMVFIIGMPRSGTSVLAAALGAHSQITNLGEQTALGAAMRDDQGSVSPMTFLKGLSAERLETARDAYLDAIGASDRSTPVLVDKMPENYWLAWAIPMMFPDALIVHMSRARLATVWSCYRHDFLDGHAYSYDFAHCLAQHDLCSDLTSAWRKTWPRNWMSLALSQFSNQPERGLGAILKRLGLQFEEACLAPASGGAVATLSKWQVRQGIDQKIASEWEAYKPLIEAKWGALL